MSAPASDPAPSDPVPSDFVPAPLFTPPQPDRTSTPLIAWVAAGVVVLGIVAALLLVTHRTPAQDATKVLPLSPYAATLKFSGLQMSESTSLSGGKSTFIDGHVQNTGSKTVAGANLQVLFSVFGGAPDQKPQQVESVPLTLIRTHEPYIDTEPVSDAPLLPGDTREFRLIFENISTNWDQQLPNIDVVQVTIR